MVAQVRPVDNENAMLKLQEKRIALKNHSFLESSDHSSLPQEVIEDLIDGILILTNQRELIYANECARRFLRQLSRCQASLAQLPEEVSHICQTLIDSRTLFPNQYWLIESKVLSNASIVFDIRARWIKLEEREQPCILLRIRDQSEYIKDVVSEESQKYGLTAREKEIWLLHRANYTYKQIAVALSITPNTVKKHMKCIYSKQKNQVGAQVDP